MSHNTNIHHGRDKELEQDDPMELHAVGIPGGNEEAQVRAFIEEYLSMGMSQDGVLEIFKNPFYYGVHHLYQKIGDRMIISIIEDCFSKFKFAGTSGR
jgi:hypothetical protein